MAILDYTEISDGEGWEHFVRDFLKEKGFAIEQIPDRGADHGKDILVSESLKGSITRSRLTWLVSCKHNALSGKAVNEDDEKNIIERLRHFKADGFMGAYSTLPSGGLNTRLTTLIANQDIKFLELFDGKRIESEILTSGYAWLVQRYLPTSYQKVQPVHMLFGEYAPLNCKNCGKDILMEMYRDEYAGNIIYVHPKGDISEEIIEDVYVVCKGDCGREEKDRIYMLGKSDSWEDLGDLRIPIFYLRNIMAIMNSIRTGKMIFTDEAFEKMKRVILALGQKVMRQMSERERLRAAEVHNLLEMFGS